MIIWSILKFDLTMMSKSFGRKHILSCRSLVCIEVFYAYFNLDILYVKCEMKPMYLIKSKVKANIYNKLNVCRLKPTTTVESYHTSYPCTSFL